MAANAWAGGLGDWGPAAPMAAVLPAVLPTVLAAVLATGLAAVLPAGLAAVLAAGVPAEVTALCGAGEKAAARAPDLHFGVGAFGFLEQKYCISSTFLIRMAFCSAM